jgi:hypothetical protein
MLRPVMRLHPATTGILLLVVCFLSACSGDDPSQPNSGPVPSFDSIWPAGVGRYWVYDQVVDEYEGGATVYDRAEDIPDLPSMAQLYADLQTDPSGALLASADTRFGSRMTADLTANPDTTVMACENYVVDPGIYESPPLGLSVGTQWRFSSDRIAVYSSRFLQWVHLDGALTPGHEFSTPLAEGLADGIVLHNRVWRVRSFDVMGETVAGCLECFYVLDMGVQRSTDESGEINGYFRGYGYGVVIYAPEVGPVYCKEKRLFAPDSILQDVPSGMFVREAVLEERGIAR